MMRLGAVQQSSKLLARGLGSLLDYYQSQRKDAKPTGQQLISIASGLILTATRFILATMGQLLTVSIILSICAFTTYVYLADQLQKKQHHIHTRLD